VLLRQPQPPAGNGLGILLDSLAGLNDSRMFLADYGFSMGVVLWNKQNAKEQVRTTTHLSSQMLISAVSSWKRFPGELLCRQARKKSPCYWMNRAFEGLTSFVTKRALRRALYSRD
jgi:hypothetical protein